LQNHDVLSTAKEAGLRSGSPEDLPLPLVATEPPVEELLTGATPSLATLPPPKVNTFEARPRSRQPTHLTAVQAFYAWIKNPRVAIAQYEDTAGLDDFIPAGEVQAYLCEDPSRLTAILTALFGSEDSRWRGRMREIVNRYSVVFAILVSIDHGQHILNFLPYEILCDDRLPFEARPAKFPWAPSDSGELFDRFQEAQSRFCAVMFNRNSTPVFDDGQPMPYLSKELLDEVGSAKVYKVQIHASHDMLQSSSASVSLESAIFNIDGMFKS
jgi:hypothetical protein